MTAGRKGAGTPTPARRARWPSRKTPSRTIGRGGQTASPRFRATMTTQPMSGTRRTAPPMRVRRLTRITPSPQVSRAALPRERMRAASATKATTRTSTPTRSRASSLWSSPRRSTPTFPPTLLPRAGATPPPRRRKPPPTCVNRAACAAFSSWSWYCSCFCSLPVGTLPSACSKPRRRPPTSRPSSSNRTRIRARCRREAKATTLRRP